MKDEDRDKLKKIYQQLNKDEEEIIVKRWHDSLLTKMILLLPFIAFIVTFLKVNTDKSILDLLAFVAVGGLLITGGLFLNYLFSKGN